LTPLQHIHRAASLQRLAPALTLSLLALAVFGAADADAYLYWTGAGGTTVNRTTTSGAEETLEWVKGASFPYGVAVDAGHVYWANNGTNSIGRADLAGGEVEPEWIKAAGNPTGVAVDSGHIYWVNPETNAISRADLAGGEVEAEWVKGIDLPVGVAVDAGHIYWVNFGTHSIGRANLAGGEIEVEWVKGAGLPYSLAIDAGHVYWTNVAAGSIGRANLAGGAVEAEWVRGAGYSEGVAVDAGHVYWAHFQTQSIGRASLAGDAVEPEFRKASNDVFGVAVGYRTADPDTTSLGFGSVLNGSLSAPQSITFTNHGNQDLSVNGFAVGGTDPAQFVIEAGNCGTVSPGGSCTVGVRFAPEASGTFSATLTARTDAETDPVVALGGTGEAPPPAPIPPPAPTPALAAPQTSVKRGPAGRSTNLRPSFVFGSDQAGVTFLCRLDKQKFHACKAKVTFHVNVGRHVLRAKAVGPTGIVDPTAAKRSFVVVPGRKR
jgi:hypothetical protein